MKPNALQSCFEEFDLNTIQTKLTAQSQSCLVKANMFFFEPSGLLADLQQAMARQTSKQPTKET